MIEPIPRKSTRGLPSKKPGKSRGHIHVFNSSPRIGRPPRNHCNFIDEDPAAPVGSHHVRDVRQDMLSGGQDPAKGYSSVNDSKSGLSSMGLPDGKRVEHRVTVEGRISAKPGV